MTRYRNRETGSVVNVDDKTAETLGASYEPVGEDKSTAKKPSSKSDK